MFLLKQQKKAKMSVTNKQTRSIFVGGVTTFYSNECGNCKKTNNLTTMCKKHGSYSDIDSSTIGAMANASLPIKGPAHASHRQNPCAKRKSHNSHRVQDCPNKYYHNRTLARMWSNSNQNETATSALET